jgi:alanyl-tRNA synthetase
MTGDELRQSFINFFAERGHAMIPSAPLVPENDPTVLFTSAGMHPLVPYLLGESHPNGRRLVSVQKCLRTDDIEEVGDMSHNTFFEMLGFWSLGDYWKQDSLRWTLEWFTRVLGLDQERISVTVFAGDSDAPRDDEAVQTLNFSTTQVALSTVLIADRVAAAKSILRSVTTSSCSTTKRRTVRTCRSSSAILT